MALKGDTPPAAEMMNCAPQGSVLGPYCFFIHIADISYAFVHSTVRSTADITRVLCEITDVNSTVRIQDGLEVIYA